MERDCCALSVSIEDGDLAITFPGDLIIRERRLDQLRDLAILEEVP